jgi:hypothetical protein
MGAVLDWLESAGASLASMALLISWLIACVWIGSKAGGRWRSTVLGWGAGLLAFLLLGLLVWPSIEALDAVACRSATDFEACMDGE